MRRFVRRVSVAVASTAIVGGAVLGAGGSASAATSGPDEHGRSSVVASGHDEGRYGHDEGRYGHHADRYGHGRGHDGERGDSWDGARGRYAHDGRQDDHRDRRHENRYRWDGHRLYVRDHGRWIDVTPFRNGRVDLWYVDQLLWDQR